MIRPMRRAGAWLLQPCLVLLWLVVATGCANTTPPKVQTTSTVPPTPTIPAPNLTPLALKTAWGTPTVRKVQNTIDANYQLYVETAHTPDGRFMLVNIGPRSLTNAQQLPTFVGLYDFNTGTMAHIHQIPGSQGQILSSGGDDRYFVWVEITDQNFSKWTMWSYNLQTQQVQQIGQNATDAQGQSNLGIYPTPWVSNGHAVWGQRLKPQVGTDVSNDVVKLIDLSSGQTQTLATSAGLPALSWPWVEYTHGDGKGNATGIFQNLESNQTIQWHDDNLINLQSIAIRGHSFVYSLLAGSSSVKYMADFTLNTTAITLVSIGGRTGDFVEFVSLSDRLIAWNSSPQLPSQVWDRKLNRLVTLPSEAYFGSMVYSSFVSWTTHDVSDDQANVLKRQGMLAPVTFNFIDTTTLP